MLLCGMPTRTKPYRHPRSLDALFPRPKVRRCSRGHSQTPEWKAHHGCSTCRKQDEEAAERERLRAGAAKAEREAARAALRPLPDPYVLRDYHGRIVGTFRAGGRRGPARRARIKQRA